MKSKGVQEPSSVYTALLQIDPEPLEAQPQDLALLAVEISLTRKYPLMVSNLTRQDLKKKKKSCFAESLNVLQGAPGALRYGQQSVLTKSFFKPQETLCPQMEQGPPLFN
jgi:hypothetical protein